jgi:CheY-like chemotaxis protein
MDVKPGRRMLVVDDQELMRELLSAVFSGQGFEVDTAADGAEALAKVGRRAPAVMLLDLRMPEVDGWQVLDALRREPRTAGLPVVVMSASGDPRCSERARAAGALYLEKPFPLGHLVEVVHTLVSADALA